jgi:hypothetical protein
MRGQGRFEATGIAPQYARHLGEAESKGAQRVVVVNRLSISRSFSVYQTRAGAI